MKNKIVIMLLMVIFCFCGSYLAEKGTPYTKEKFDSLPALDKGSKNGFDINTATKEEFMAIRGISEIYAQNIISARAELGYFRDMRDLLYAEGIGIKRMKAISEMGKIN